MEAPEPSTPAWIRQRPKVVLIFGFVAMVVAYVVGDLASLSLLQFVSVCLWVVFLQMTTVAMLHIAGGTRRAGDTSTDGR